MTFPLGVEHVQGMCDRFTFGLLAVRIGQLQPLQQSRPSIGHGMFQLIKTIEVSCPSFSVTVLRQVADYPAEAIGFDAHQNGLPADEDFVEGSLDHVRLSEFVEYFENRGGLLLRCLRYATERTYRGGLVSCKIFKSRCITGKLTPSA